MTDRVSNFANKAETELTATMGSTELTATVTSTTGFPSSPCYIVVDPDDDAKREIIYFDGTFTATTLVTTTLSNRYLSGSASGSGITHDIGALVVVVPVAQWFEDLHDRVSGHDHTGTTDEGVRVDHGATSNLDDDDHTQYYNAARHTKAVHDALALDHGTLTGTGDDDHAQYALVDGTRAFTGVVSGITPTATAHLSTKGYVDGRYVQDRYDPGSRTSVPASEASAVQHGATKTITPPKGTGVSHTVSATLGVNITKGSGAGQVDGSFMLEVSLDNGSTWTTETAPLSAPSAVERNSGCVTIGVTGVVTTAIKVRAKSQREDASAGSTINFNMQSTAVFVS